MFYNSPTTAGKTTSAKPLKCSEINKGLDVVEQWNGATDFVFFA